MKYCEMWNGKWFPELTKTYSIYTILVWWRYICNIECGYQVPFHMEKNPEPCSLKRSDPTLRDVKDESLSCSIECGEIQEWRVETQSGNKT